MEKQYRILRHSVNNAESKEVQELASDVRHDFILGLREDKNFKQLICDEQVPKIYRNNLKLTPNEFAFPITMVLSRNDLVEVLPDEENPGNVKIKLSAILNQTNNQFLKQMVNRNGYLLQDKFQSFLESRISVFLKEIENEMIYFGSRLQLQHSKQGPAHTIAIKSGDCQFSIQFIPLFLFKADTKITTRVLTSEYWEAIPKPMGIKNNPSFRTSYIEEESKILTKKYHLRLILCLTMKFRNLKPRMTNLKSYHVKSLFLFLDEEFGPNFWNRPIVFILKDVFNRLLMNLESKEIKSFWHEKLNLLDGVAISKIESMKDEVKAATELLMQPIVNLPIIFFTEEEQARYLFSANCEIVVMDELLRKLSAAINIDKHREKYTKIYDHVRTAFIKGLKGNKDFKLLFSDIKLAGSYADNLKITKPNEFDVMVIFKVPYNEHVKILPDNKNRGNVFIDLTEVMKLLAQEKKDIYNFLRKIVNTRQLLLQDKFQRWLEELVRGFMNKINHELVYEDESKLQLKYSIQGPAHTIYVESGDCQFSIDFVPGFQFVAKKSISNRQLYSLCWEAVPKPLGIQNNPSFRTSYADSEREIFVKKNQFKNVLRLMKKFRDNNPELVHLKSYFIKSLFLWHNEHCDPSFWQKSTLEILKEMFDAVERALKNMEIKFFWDEELNMLDKFSRSQVESMYHKVRIAKKCLDCAVTSEKFLRIFLTDEEISQLRENEEES